MRYRGMLLRPVLVAGLNEEGLLVRQVITSILVSATSSWVLSRT